MMGEPEIGPAGKICWLRGERTAVESGAMLGRIRISLAAILLLSGIAAAQQILPRPQIASAEGKVAPDFTLRDEHGQALRLASLRGKRVLLIFYRGYW